MSDPRLAPLRARPASSALLFDVDGTLAPIVARPEQAGVPAGTRALLEELASRFGLVACVSGRRATQARDVVGLAGLTYVGNHGFELLEPGAAAATVEPAVARRAERAASFLGERDGEELERAGIRVEDKGPIQALHWRGARDEAAGEALARELEADARAAGLVTHWGRKVLELRPVAGIDKGAAVHRLLSDRGPLAGALYAGDDRTDLDAFRALRRLAAAGRVGAAVCVGVASDEGPREVAASADLVVDGPERLPDVLRELAER